MLRVAAPLEALVGFVLLTAVSWVLQIYPALERRRAFALRLSVFRQAGVAAVEPRISDLAGAANDEDREGHVSEQTLLSLTEGVCQLCVDLTQNYAAYYFHDADRKQTLPSALRYAKEVSDKARGHPEHQVLVAAAALAVAVADFASVLDARFQMSAGTPMQC